MYWCKFESDGGKNARPYACALMPQDYFKTWCFVKLKPESQEPDSPLGEQCTFEEAMEESDGECGDDGDSDDFDE